MYNPTLEVYHSAFDIFLKGVSSARLSDLKLTSKTYNKNTKYKSVLYLINHAYIIITLT